MRAVYEIAQGIPAPFYGSAEAEEISSGPVQRHMVYHYLHQRKDSLLRQTLHGSAIVEGLTTTLVISSYCKVPVDECRYPSVTIG